MPLSFANFVMGHYGMVGRYVMVGGYGMAMIMGFVD